jgi:hypothetical protein
MPHETLRKLRRDNKEISRKTEQKIPPDDKGDIEKVINFFASRFRLGKPSKY